MVSYNLFAFGKQPAAKGKQPIPQRQQPAPQSAPQPVPQPAAQPVAPQAGVPVNAYSNASDPRKLFPLHFDYLMRDIFTAGDAPETWRVLDATETRLDEHGMEVEFTLIRNGTDMVWRRRVLMNAGRLVRIVTR